MKLYYKIIFGFDAEDYIQIDGSELEKAYYAFLKKKDAVYSGGAIRGTNISAIQPDYHRAMGWNRGHVLLDDDFEEISKKGIDNAHMHNFSEIKSKVHHLIQTNQENMIGKNIEESTVKLIA